MKQSKNLSVFAYLRLAMVVVEEGASDDSWLDSSGCGDGRSPLRALVDHALADDERVVLEERVEVEDLRNRGFEVLASRGAVELVDLGTGRPVEDVDEVDVVEGVQRLLVVVDEPVAD